MRILLCVQTFPKARAAFTQEKGTICFSREGILVHYTTFSLQLWYITLHFCYIERKFLQLGVDFNTFDQFSQG